VRRLRKEQSQSEALPNYLTQLGDVVAHMLGDGEPGTDRPQMPRRLKSLGRVVVSTTPEADQVWVCFTPEAGRLQFGATLVKFFTGRAYAAEQDDLSKCRAVGTNCVVIARQPASLPAA
jgi:hypothetical protein